MEREFFVFVCLPVFFLDTASHSVGSIHLKLRVLLPQIKSLECDDYRYVSSYLAHFNISYKINVSFLYDLLVSVINNLLSMKTYVSTKAYSQMFIVACFLIFTNLRQFHVHQKEKNQI